MKKTEQNKPSMPMSPLLPVSQEHNRKGDSIKQLEQGSQTRGPRATRVSLGPQCGPLRTAMAERRDVVGRLGNSSLAEPGLASSRCPRTCHPASTCSSLSHSHTLMEGTRINSVPGEAALEIVVHAPPGVYKPNSWFSRAP